MELSHLHVIEFRLSRMRQKLRLAKTNREIEMFQVLVKQIEKELSDEKKFLGITDSACEMTDDEILSELQS